MKLIFVAFVFIAIRVWGLIDEIATFFDYHDSMKFRQTMASAVLVFIAVSCIVYTLSSQISESYHKYIIAFRHCSSYRHFINLPGKMIDDIKILNYR